MTTKKHVKEISEQVSRSVGKRATTNERVGRKIQTVMQKWLSEEVDIEIKQKFNSSQEECADLISSNPRFERFNN